MPEDNEFGLSDTGGAGFREFARQLAREFGGAKGLAKKLRHSLDDPETPPNVRQSIMALVIKSYAQASDDDAKANFESMSRDELVAYIRRLMDGHGGKLPPNLNGESSA